MSGTSSVAMQIGLPSCQAQRIRSISSSGNNRNASLRIQDISKSFAANISDIFSDLIEIATYVYCADQAVTRGGTTDRGMGANWRRHLRFHIPVRQPDIWLSPEISECLSSTLGFLSDDHYTFKFTKLENPPPFERYLEGLGDPSLKPEEIVLFSGGLDSLAGAVQEAVIEKKQIILVSHRSSPKIFTKQRHLFKELVRHCAGTCSLARARVGNQVRRLGKGIYATDPFIFICCPGGHGSASVRATRNSNV